MIGFVKGLYWFWLTVLMLFPVSSEAASANISRVDKSATVAVMDLGTRPGAVPAVININGAGKSSSEYLIFGLANSGCFNVMEKDLVVTSMAARGVNTTGLIDPDTAKIIGDELNSRYILYGNLAGVTIADNKTQVLVGGITVCTVRAHIIARLMDVATGDILMACKGDGNSKSTFTEIGVNNGLVLTVQIGTAKVTQDSVHNAVKKAAIAAVEDLLSQLGVKKDKKVAS